MIIPFILFFTLGDCWLQTFSRLPAPFFVVILVLGLLFIYVSLRKRCPWLLCILALGLGFAWTWWCAESVMAWTLPKDQEGRPQVVTGIVASLPTSDQWQTNFIFAIKKPYQTLIRLSSRDKNLVIRVGDEWVFLVRMKRIHGVQNPGGNDYEAWALQKGLRATGYIIASHDNQFITHHPFSSPIDQLRQQLQSRILAQLPQGSSTAPWLMALIIGERQGVSPESWQVLRNTGTNHLMAIAGLHIGLMAAFMHFITSWLWRRFPVLLLRVPAQQAGACSALITGFVYGTMAGFSIPTQRACIMLAVFIFTLLTKRKINGWNAWALAMFIVILINPLSVLTDSFWLSFATIALIIYGMSGRLQATTLWWKYGRPQWVIGFGLMPFSLQLFQQSSLISFMANTIAIPWLGFLILPLCFLSGLIILFSPSVAGWLLQWADKSLAGLWSVLTWLSHLHFSTWHQAIPNQGLFLLAVIGFLLLLLPAGVAGRWLGVLWIAPLLLYQPMKPAPGEYWLSLLDVGQGLSVVIQTHSHTLVYDTGPKFNAESDMGENVVLPYLNTIGRNKIDMMVISHGDNDHIGGAHAILSQTPVLSVKTSVPDKLPSAVTQLCLRGEGWQWDKVNFSFIYPTKDNLTLNNDSSCVLRIDNGTQRVLLAGDIEKYAEKEILSSVPAQLATTILIAPHHGSKSSGIPRFIAATHPQYVLYGVGYRNRYHFPNQGVVAAYKEIMAVQEDTANAGEIEVRVGENVATPMLFRATHLKYWW